MKTQKGAANMVLVAIIVILLIIIGYFVLNKKQTTTPQVVNQETITETSSQSPIPAAPVGTKSYTNNQYGFSFKYDSDGTMFSALDNITWYGKLSWSDKPAINLELHNINTFPRSNSSCASFSKTDKVISGKKMEIIQQVDCDSGDMGADSRSSGQFAIIPLTSTKELVIGYGSYTKTLIPAQVERFNKLISSLEFKASISASKTRSQIFLETMNKNLSLNKQVVPTTVSSYVGYGFGSGWQVQPGHVEYIKAQLPTVRGDYTSESSIGYTNGQIVCVVMGMRKYVEGYPPIITHNELVCMDLK